MTIKAVPAVENGCLMVAGKVVLSGVPPNVVLSAAGCGSAFLGASSPSPSSRLVFNLGVLRRCRFMCLFRAKIWWMIPRVGETGSEIPLETELLLLELREESAVDDETPSKPSNENTQYILFLPVLDGQFRASLQGTSANELHLCIESGDASIQTSQVLESVHVNSGDNPFKLVKNSVKILEKHKGTFSHIENKKIPAHVDWFGWCTWDAFYTEVNPQGIRDGLQSFLDGGCSPKYVVIDDGWQDTVHINKFSTRLVDIKENKKFKTSGSENSSINFHEFISGIKEKYGLKYVYMWHALTGYWGGLLPSSEAVKKYNPKLVYPIQSPGNVDNLRDIAMDNLEKYGVGIIEPGKIYDFYNDLHGYLARNGVDGVKVDVQNVMETLGTGYGGRVTLTRQYQEALEQSVVRNFRENNLICCMSHNTECMYSSKVSAVARASEDFMPREPTFQTLHIASVAFVSYLLGEIALPDWDMFQSKHSTAAFHGAARAIGGCAVYVSDKPGSHDFGIIKKLVLPDGSILRARHAGRPTRDCLFVDPVMDGKSLMKIWNLNKLTGVIGVFNCQGAGTWPWKEGGVELPSTAPTLPPISGHVSPSDVEFLDETVGEDRNGDFLVYAFNSASLSRLQKTGNLDVSLRTLQFEIFTVCPIRVFGENIHFAAIGLLDMYNSGGAVEALSCVDNGSGCTVRVKVRGCGRFGAYSSTEPKRCFVDTNEAESAYDAEDDLLTVELQGLCSVREIEFVY